MRTLLPLSAVVLVSACQAATPSAMDGATPPGCYLAQQPHTPGLVKMRGAPVTLIGTQPAVGQSAPEARAVGADMKSVALSSLRGKTVVLITVPSVDTPVCGKETRAFHEKLAALPDVAGVVVSMDLPQAQKRFCAAEGITNLTLLSDFRHWEVGLHHGVRMENGLLARSVWVIAPDGRIVYREIVKEVTQEPDYAAALAAAGKK